MLDLHSHILPGLDDGAKDDTTALSMLEMAAANGTRGIVATPHVIEGEWLPAWSSIVTGCRRLSACAEARGIKIAIYPGAEVAVNYDLLSLLDKPGPYCINGGRYLLLELPSNNIPAYADDFFFTLQTRGFLPIIAHPERNQEIRRQPERMVGWIRKGLFAQINAGSLAGQIGTEVMRFAEQLVTRRMAHCLGSDAHSIRTRRPILTAARNKIAVLAGAKVAEEITAVTPGEILAGKEIIPPEIMAEKGAGNTILSCIARVWKLS